MKNSFSFLLALLFLTVSCASNDTSNRSGYYEDITEQPDILVPLSIEPLPDSIKDLYYDPMYFSIENESDEYIKIEPQSTYYDAYISDKRLTVRDKDVCSDDLQFPVLNFYLNNNTDNPLSISSLDINVSKSILDTLPYVYFVESQLLNNALVIRNESWIDWGGMKLSYTILKRGETFDGKYKHNLSIPYFEDRIIVDFYQDFIDMGLNDELNAFCDDSFFDTDDLKCDFLVGHNKSSDHLNIGMLSEMESEEVDVLSYPFEYAASIDNYYYIFARIYGKISFSNSDFNKEFEAEIYITKPAGDGMELDTSDIFGLELQPEGKNYTKSFPYTTTIAPNESERIQLTLKCPKSAIHDLVVKFNNDNGLDIRSKDIKLHLLNGRHSSQQPARNQNNYYYDKN